MKLNSLKISNTWQLRRNIFETFRDVPHFSVLGVKRTVIKMEMVFLGLFPF